MSAYVIPNDATHVALTVIEFSDGTHEEQPLMFGSFAQCDKVAASIPAVAYSGPKQAMSARACVVELEPMQNCCGQRHPAGPCAEVKP